MQETTSLSRDPRLTLCRRSERKWTTQDNRTWDLLHWKQASYHWTSDPLRPPVRGSSICC